MARLTFLFGWGLVLLFLLASGAERLGEFLWFQELGYASVFWRILLTQLMLLALSTLLVAAYLFANLLVLARHLDLPATAHAVLYRAHRPPPPAPAISDRSLKSLFAVLSFAVALLVGLIYASDWDGYLRFAFAQNFDQTDPVFGHDLGFYLFVLPFVEKLQNTVTSLAFLVTVALGAVYAKAGILRYVRGQGIEAPHAVLHHLLANAILFLLAWASGYVLDRYELLSDSSGAVFGAGYTDVTVTRWALWAAAAVTVAFGVALYIMLSRGRILHLPVLLGGFAGGMVALLGFLPLTVQQFVVEPNELELETPYLKRNIALTRAAFALETIEERRYSADAGLDAATIDANRDTVDNIRLWDWRPLSQTFKQLQQIRTYYTFLDVDIDRYRFGDDYRQVLLSARELSRELPGKGTTWVNRRLQYTHGFGVVMSPAAEKAPDGRPVLLAKDLPPETSPGLSLDEAAIYYGEEDSGYRIVATGVREFDYPSGDENVYTRYDGDGGVPLTSFWRRLLYAWLEFDVGILVSDYIGPMSRIQLWRPVQERIGKLAPFLELDPDPYVVVSDGRLYWIQDAYTVADGYPYAEPAEAGVSYIRNSIKVVIDAFNGDVAFYVIDPADPVVRLYRAAFPALFRDLDAMPQGLRAHLRYPQRLFELQVRQYAKYHMTVPQVFYNDEDLWTAPREKYGGEVIPMVPYYVLLHLPGEARLEFMLMTPMTPANRDNMIAWMAARADAPHYGDLLVFKLPKERLILGPLQVEAMIDQDTTISRQLSLWDQRGSRVIRGNLLVIPIDESLLYIEPVYLRAEENDIPQLKRIIVSDGETLAMEPTLEEALQVVFGAGPREPGEPTMAEASPGIDLDQARGSLDEAEQALGRGDWQAFGRAMQELRQLLTPDADKSP
jgi:uncharacterized membrane protein (UPF0182 family)